MRLMIVDDHLLFREGIAAIFKSEADIEITGLVGTVQSAIACALTTRPDIILMDFTLPDGTGVDATRQILANQPHCKIIFLTMSEQNEHLLSAISAGAKGYLLKDMHPSQLKASLRAVHQGEGTLAGSMTLHLMEALARSQPPEIHPQFTPVKLTLRETDVLRVLATGKTNLEIAEQLFISENTVRYHIHSILAKLDLPNRKEAVRYAQQHGLG